MSLHYTHYWQYFLAIEDSLQETSRFVEFSDNNFSAYSIEFARILLTTCSEIDVICKMLCKKIDVTKKPENINDYRTIITAEYPKFYSMKVIVRYGGFSLTPWEKWNTENPAWWKSYNNVKHQRSEKFQESNLENTLNAVAGLYCLILYCFQEELYALKLEPSAKLFSTEETPYHYISGGYKLPDF